MTGRFIPIFTRNLCHGDHIYLMSHDRKSVCILHCFVQTGSVRCVSPGGGRKENVDAAQFWLIYCLEPLSGWLVRKLCARQKWYCSEGMLLVMCVDTSAYLSCSLLGALPFDTNVTPAQSSHFYWVLASYDYILSTLLLTVWVSTWAAFCLCATGKCDTVWQQPDGWSVNPCCRFALVLGLLACPYAAPSAAHTPLAAPLCDRTCSLPVTENEHFVNLAAKNAFAPTYNKLHSHTSLVCYVRTFVLSERSPEMLWGTLKAN